MSSSYDTAGQRTSSPSSPHRTEPSIWPVAEWHTEPLTRPDNRHGQTVRVWARVVPGQSAEALAYAALSESAWRFSGVTPEGGSDNAAALYPLALMHVGLVASYMNEIFGAAETRDVDVHDLALTQDSYYLAGDARALEAASAQALPLELEIRIASSTAADELGELLLGALASAPQNGLLRQSTDVQITLAGVGAATAPLESQPAGATTADDFAAAWAWSEADAPPTAALVTRLEAGAANSSALPLPARAESSTSTDLHGRATCRLSDSGGKHIEHRWRGDIAPPYAFRSDEAEGFGGRSLAPDAVTYMATGLALSFAAQIARAAGGAQGPLRLCRAIVDVHFPFGGLIEPGVANPRIDPPQMQIMLAGADDAASARALLARSVRACPLQALCRSRLVTNIRIRTL